VRSYSSHRCEGTLVEVSDAFLAAEVAVMRNLLAGMRARYGSAEAYLEGHGRDPRAVATLRRALLDHDGSEAR